MTKQISENQTGKEAVASGVLPWWAVLILAQHSGSATFFTNYRHYHHCTGCGCVMICQYKGCKSPEMRCPDCDTRKISSQGGN